jgi:hypothetical protein
MTPRDQIPATAALLRTAVEAQCYADAGRHLATYCRQVEEVLRAQSSAPENAHLIADSKLLFEWTRRSVLAGAAHDADRLCRLPPKNAYSSLTARTQTWGVDG